jgi:aspartate aminotransferase-like enzyme
VNLRTPGPTPCPPDVLAAMGRQMDDHRGPVAAALVERITAGLKRAFQTRNDILIFTSSGTGGLEAAIVNTLSPGDKVLAVSIGNFGDRFAAIAKAYGAAVTKLDFPAGQAADPEAVAAALRADPGIRAVLVTHNETSTGVMVDLPALAKVVKGAGKLLFVDAVSSLGCIPLETDAWGCDVVVTASQKGLMSPPGLAHVAVSPAAWELYRQASLPRFYFDLGRHRDLLAKGETPWTPAVSALFGLDVALRQILGEGLDRVFERHRQLAELTRRELKALGFRLVARDESWASNSVTAAYVPEGVDAGALIRTVRSEFNVEIQGGQAELAGKIIRVAHMGYVSEPDMVEALGAIRAALNRVGTRT